MGKIKFFHVIDSAPPNPLLYNSIKFSDRDKFDYTVISLHPDNGLQQQLAEIGVRFRSLNYESRRQAFSTLWKLYSYFAAEKPQIVQTHLFDASLIGLTAARLARVPVTIFTGHHSHETPLYGRRLLTFVDGLSGRLLAKKTLAPSQQMKNIFIEQLKVPPKRIEVVNHGFDLAAWRASADRGSDIRQEFGLENKIVFGAVGRLWWVKGFDALIEAFGNATVERNDAVLLIVGGGDQDSLQRIIDSRGLRDKVFLTGRREDIAEVMNSFNILVHTSMAESFGMVFIEAFALGKPIVSTSVGIAPEIIENGVNGFLIDRPDVPSISTALEKMLNAKPNWRSMGEKGEMVAERFSVKETQAVCDTLYEKWLNETKSNRKQNFSYVTE